MTAGKAESLFDQLSLGYTEWGVVPQLVLSDIESR